MALLKDHFNPEHQLQVVFTSRHPESDRGCTFSVTVSSDNGITGNTTKFGWTNHILNQFITMLEQFPMERYDGYFSHYDDPFEWLWYLNKETKVYSVLILIHSCKVVFKATAEQLHRFGAEVKEEMKHAPKPETIR
ncbi:hypothetical protein M3223_10075 [Paenibacillus pasadenensis]|uniref:hypothetical protein n=1 Tax=Paenibacillus pasadenensis TaxID=217090 RepID=UPI00203B2A8F|nr:hypothetical protein [Paenibacillus pasadenensis]MCM3747702.1 hypothetical protein [Paenibacillus pasadenensis]